MKIKLTRREDDVLWLIQRKSRCLDVSRALRLTMEEVHETLESLAKKTGWPITPKEVNNGKFWKQLGIVTPFGER